MSMYFSYDPVMGIEFHKTANEAKARAVHWFQQDREMSPECGWSDKVEDICWGALCQKVAEVARDVAVEKDEDSYWKTVRVKYEMKEVEGFG